MTLSEARKLAVESAYEAWCASSPTWRDASTQVIAAYERAMADAGWRMARDVGEKACAFGLAHDPYADGWNDCRAAMLGDANG